MGADRVWVQAFIFRHGNTIAHSLPDRIMSTAALA